MGRMTEITANCTCQVKLALLVWISRYDIETRVRGRRGDNQRAIPLGERHRRVRNQTDDQIYRKEEKVLLFDKG